LLSSNIYMYTCSRSPHTISLSHSSSPLWHSFLFLHLLFLLLLPPNCDLSKLCLLCSCDYRCKTLCLTLKITLKKQINVYRMNNYSKYPDVVQVETCSVVWYLQG
jgi:hypothetical protein